MTLEWLTKNAKLQSGIALINSIPQSKFNLLLQHIARSKNDEFFTPSELVKLQDTLKLDESNIQLLLLSITHILKEANKIILKPSTFQKQLIDELEFNEEKANEFVKVWTEQINKDFDLENCKKLDDVSWELNVQSASKYLNKQAGVHTRLQLHFNNDSKEDDNKIFDLNEEELLSFFNTLESIQNKLDRLK